MNASGSSASLGKMKRVLARIHRRMSDYQRSEFLAFLRDPEVEPLAKFAFAPKVAHFVLTFGDLCRMLLVQHPPKDRFQELVNANSVEDQDHWQWYLSDLGLIGQDPTLPLSKAIAMVWGEDTRRTRRLSYELCHRAIQSDSLGKLVLVHVIEGAFKATVNDLAVAAGQFTASTGKKLAYLGAGHSDAEASHTIDQADVRHAIESVELSADKSAEYEALVDGAFVLFEDFAQEMLDVARAAHVGSLLVAKD